MIQEIQIKVTMKCHSAFIRMATIQNITASNAGEDSEQELSFTASMNAKWHGYFGRQFGSFLKN